MKMERRDFLKVASMGAAAAMMPSAVEPAQAQQSTRANKPNIIFIVSDQHRAGLTKREGYRLDTSPHWTGSPRAAWALIAPTAPIRCACPAAPPCLRGDGPRQHACATISRRM